MPRTTFVDNIIPTERVTLTELATMLGVNPATTFRWAGQGIRGVRLVTQKLGGRTVVTPESLRQFMAALNSVEGVLEPKPPVRPTGREP